MYLSDRACVCVFCAREHASPRIKMEIVRNTKFGMKTTHVFFIYNV